MLGGKEEVVAYHVWLAYRFLPGNLVIKSRQNFHFYVLFHYFLLEKKHWVLLESHMNVSMSQDTYIH